jgi:hypothetical protein
MTTQPNRKRRAILQGSLAAPVVLTVSSASATAVTSFGKCLANQLNQQPAPSLTFTLSPDNWYRVPVTATNIKIDGVENWYYLDPSVSKYVKLSTLEITSLGQLNVPPGWIQGTAPRYLLVWVDPTTGIKSQYYQALRPTRYTAATMSCMTSVQP